MPNKVRVLIIDDDTSFMDGVEKYFSSHAVIKIVKKIKDGDQAISFIKNEYKNFDLIITDILLTNQDGFSVIKETRKLSTKMKIIVLSNYISENIINKLSNYEIDYFLLKPINHNILEERILDLFEDYNTNKNDSFSLHKNISKLLHSLGVPSHIKGYEYIRESIALMYSNPDMLGAITKELYPEIASKYDTTSSRVERAIRHAIEVSWNRGDYDLMEDIFGHSVDYDKAKPTNSEFIATLADKLRLDKIIN